LAATRREQTSSESRGLLLSAAAEMFAKQGFRRTTFVDIAERAGISRGSIPWHFGDKNGLLKAVVDDIAARTLAEAPRPIGVAAGVDQVHDFIRQPTTRLLITLLAEAVEPNSPVHAFYEEFHRAMRAWVTSWTGGVRLPGGVSRDAFVAMVCGTVIGIHQQWRVAPDDVDLDETLAALKAMISGFGSGSGVARAGKRSAAR
jgi:TetR/AcrR family acrAB operon transcriptional repressor